MIGVIPNPKKTFQIEKPSNDVKNAIEYIQYISTKYKLFKANPTVNQFTYEAMEFLSLGVYIDIITFSSSDQRTDVSIEIRRKVGSFDRSIEVDKANQHLNEITDLICQSVEIELPKRIAAIEQRKTEIKNVESERLQKIEDAKIRAEEERQNRPAQYYAKQAFYILATIGLIVGLIWVAIKAFG